MLYKAITTFIGADKASVRFYTDYQAACRYIRHQNNGSVKLVCLDYVPLPYEGCTFDDLSWQCDDVLDKINDYLPDTLEVSVTLTQRDEYGEVNLAAIRSDRAVGRDHAKSLILSHIGEIFNINTDPFTDLQIEVTEYTLDGFCSVHVCYENDRDIDAYVWTRYFRTDRRGKGNTSWLSEFLPDVIINSTGMKESEGFNVLIV